MGGARANWLSNLELDETLVLDVSALVVLPVLERLKVDGTSVSDVGPLQEASVMHQLWANDTEVSVLPEDLPMWGSTSKAMKSAKGDVDRFDAAAQAWGSAEIIDLDRGGRAHYPEVAVDSSGDAVVVWQQLPDLDGADFRVYARRYDASSGTWGSVELLEDDGGGAAIDPVLAGDPAGNVVVVWHREHRSGYEARTNRYDAATQQWATPESSARS